MVGCDTLVVTLDVEDTVNLEEVVLCEELMPKVSMCERLCYSDQNI